MTSSAAPPPSQTIHRNGFPHNHGTHAWTTTAPVGRWAIERRHDHRIIGGASLLLLPRGYNDLEMAWQLNSAVARTDHEDHVAEIVTAVASWAFDRYVEEVFAVAPPNDRTAEPLGSTYRQNGSTRR